ncbi:MAG: BrnA antitoxin family protein [Burkholderiaceae bacterium]
MKRPAPDQDNPEWTAAAVAKAVPFGALPAALREKLMAGGPQKSPTKERITLRLSRDVVDSFRATGTGWQGRLDAALKDWLRAHQD